MKHTNSSVPWLQLQLLSGLLVPLCSAFSFLLDSRGKTSGLSRVTARRFPINRWRSPGGPVLDVTAPRAAGQPAGRGIIDGTLKHHNRHSRSKPEVFNKLNANLAEDNDASLFHLSISRSNTCLFHYLFTYFLRFSLLSPPLKDGTGLGWWL